MYECVCEVILSLRFDNFFLKTSVSDYSFLLLLQVRNDKARRYLTSMRKKQPVSFAQKFPNADPLGLKLLERLLAFDPKDRPTAEEVCVIMPIILFELSLDVLV